MNQLEKKKFVRDLLHSIEDKIIDSIDAETIPDEWDGFELRELIFDCACVERGFPPKKIRGNTSRVRAYRNTVLVNNL